MPDNPTYLLADGIAPLIIFALIAIGQIIFKAISAKEENSDEDVAEAEEKHREELRKQIRARMEAARQANKGKPSSIPQTIFRDVPEVPKRPQEPVVMKVPEPTVQPAAPIGMPEDPMIAIQKRIQALKQQGIEAQHQVEAIQAKAKQKAAVVKTPRKKKVSGASLRNSLKQSLSNPQSAQQAILLAEVLGKPKALQ